MKKEYPSVLKNRSFRRLCAAQFTSLVATYAIYFASMALVEEITRSSAQMGLMIFSSTLPGLLFGLLAGVVVDRYERVKVMMAAHLHPTGSGERRFHPAHAPGRGSGGPHRHQEGVAHPGLRHPGGGGGQHSTGS
jgi:hypothetical protein